MMFLCSFFVDIDVDGGFQGPLWRSDVGNDGFEMLHVFGEMFGNVYEVRWEGQRLPFEVTRSLDSSMRWVWQGDGEHSTDLRTFSRRRSRGGRGVVSFSSASVDVVWKHPSIVFMIWRCTVENLVCCCIIGYLISSRRCHITAA